LAEAQTIKKTAAKVNAVKKSMKKRTSTTTTTTTTLPPKKKKKKKGTTIGLKKLAIAPADGNILSCYDNFTLGGMNYPREIMLSHFIAKKLEEGRNLLNDCIEHKLLAQLWKSQNNINYFCLLIFYIHCMHHIKWNRINCECLVKALYYSAI
jgi:hypothetical protein